MRKAALCRGRTGGLVGPAGMVLALLIVGCAGESMPVTGATLPADGPKPSVSGPPSSQPEGQVQPGTGFEQPTGPDPAFVQRLVDQFDAVQNTSVRHLAQHGAVDQGFIDYQRAIYAPEWLQRSLEGWRIEKDALSPKPGAARTTVGEVVRWKQGCIVAAVRTDYGAWFAIRQPPLPKRYVAVAPRPEQAVKDANPTGWWMTYDGWQDNELPPDGLCA
ncbi:MAG: hypothetical protein ACRDYX_06515 [Egibacteraceae bacterium]